MDTANTSNKKEEAVGEVIANAIDVALVSVDAAGAAIDTVITVASHVG